MKHAQQSLEVMGSEEKNNFLARRIIEGKDDDSVGLSDGSQDFQNDGQFLGDDSLSEFDVQEATDKINSI